MVGIAFAVSLFCSRSRLLLLTRKSVLAVELEYALMYQSQTWLEAYTETKVRVAFLGRSGHGYVDNN